MESEQAAEQPVSIRAGAGSAPVSQAKHQWSGISSQVSRARRARRRSGATARHRRSGRAPGPSRGCRDASSGTGAAAAGRPALRSKSVCRLSPRSPTPKTRTGPGGGYIEAALICHRRSPVVGATAGIQLHTVSHAPAGPQSAVRLRHQPARRRAEARKRLYARLLDRETPRVRRPAVPPADRRDRPPRPPEAQRGRRAQHRDGRRHGRPPPRAAAEPAARALPSLHQRRDRHADADLLQRPPRLPRKSSCRSATTRYVSGTAEFYDGMLQMVHPDRVVDEKGFATLPLVEPVYPLTEGLSLAQCAARDRRRARPPARSAGMAGRGLARARAPGRPSAMRCGDCTTRTSRATSRPTARLDAARL